MHEAPWEAPRLHWGTRFSRSEKRRSACQKSCLHLSSPFKLRPKQSEDQSNPEKREKCRLLGNKRRNCNSNVTVSNIWRHFSFSPQRSLYNSDCGMNFRHTLPRVANCSIASIGSNAWNSYLFRCVSAHLFVPEVPRPSLFDVEILLFPFPWLLDIAPCHRPPPLKQNQIHLMNTYLTQVKC